MSMDPAPIVVALVMSAMIVAAAAGEKAAEEWRLHVDRTQGFSIRYPHDFVVRARDVSRYAEVEPTPVASTVFMNPTMAAGDLAGIEPPDLDLRVYAAADAESLRSWLASVGLASSDRGDTVKAYRSAAASGLTVCTSTLSAPGCSVYVLHDDRVYQLTPISREGERMIETFAPLP